MSTLASGLLLGAVGAFLYLTVAGFLVARTWRMRSWALFGLALFWGGVGTYALADALMTGLWLIHLATLAVGVAALHAKVVSICAAFAGLVGYLAYVYFASRRVVVAVGVWYVALAAAFEVWYLVRGPRGIAAQVWGTSVQYGHEGPQTAWWALLVALFVPGIVASLLYARLARYATSAMIRRRILATSAALMLFFVPSLLAWLYGHWYWWGLVEKIVGSAAGVLMLAMAYSAWAARRIPDEDILDRVRTDRHRASVELATRVRELV